MNCKSLCFVVLAGVLTVAGCGDRGAEVKAALEGIAPGDRVTVVLRTELGLSLSNAAGEMVHWETGELTGTVSSMDDERLTVAVDLATLPDDIAEVLPSDGNRLVVDYGQGVGNSSIVTFSIEKSADAEQGVDVILAVNALKELYLWDGDEKEKLL